MITATKTAATGSFADDWRLAERGDNNRNNGHITGNGLASLPADFALKPPVIPP